jgi:hypothetical protein
LGCSQSAFTPEPLFIWGTKKLVHGLKLAPAEKCWCWEGGGVGGGWPLHAHLCARHATRPSWNAHQLANRSPCPRTHPHARTLAHTQRHQHPPDTTAVTKRDPSAAYTPLPLCPLHRSSVPLVYMSPPHTCPCRAGQQQRVATRQRSERQHTHTHTHTPCRWCAPAPKPRARTAGRQAATGRPRAPQRPLRTCSVSAVEYCRHAFAYAPDWHPGSPLCAG